MTRITDGLPRWALALALHALPAAAAPAPEALWQLIGELATASTQGGQAVGEDLHRLQQVEVRADPVRRHARAQHARHGQHAQRPSVLNGTQRHLPDQFAGVEVNRTHAAERRGVPGH